MGMVKKRNAVLNIKTDLTKLYNQKLREAKQKPMSSPRYQYNIEKIQNKLQEIRLGNYQATKSDLKIVKTNTSNKTLKAKIDEAIKSFDTNGESFFVWNKAETKSPYASGGVDLSVFIEFTLDDNSKTFRYYGIISNRLDNAVTDKMIHEQILYGSHLQDNSYVIETSSGVTLHIKSYRVIWAGRA